jgi:hypothetical protein
MRLLILSCFKARSDKVWHRTAREDLVRAGGYRALPRDQDKEARAAVAEGQEARADRCSVLVAEVLEVQEGRAVLEAAVEECLAEEGGEDWGVKR